MLPIHVARRLVAALLVVSMAGGCSTETGEEAPRKLREGRLEGRIFPIADTMSVQGIVPDELAELAREAFGAEAALAAQARGLEVTPISPGRNDGPDVTPVEPSLVPGEAIVKLRRPIEETLEALQDRPEFARYRFEAGDWATTEILSLRFRRGEAVPTEAETIEVAELLHATGIFGHAQPNHYRYATAVPNDELYPRTWHYHLLDMESAWSITTGSPDVVIAVIDSGAREHEDLTRLLPGYDFVSHLSLAGDGDGRDPDPSPVNSGRSSFHGQHVAGTIAADSDNEVGIPGMDWKAQILPVRVLGVRGYGTSLDVIAGINWATGGEVPKVPLNPTPAHVLNLSLGGSELVPAEQEVLDLARARGAIAIVAAGNDNIDARTQSLSGYQGVIVVGAVDAAGGRAPYSNYGPAVDVMAPGGNLAADLNGDELPDGVYSLWFSSQGTVSSYRFQQGTSMAAPHVAGLVGLMKAIEPSLKADDVERILRETANSDFQCREGCGAGLIDPRRALEAAQLNGISEPRLHLPLERLDIGPRHKVVLRLGNAGNAPLAWFAKIEGTLASYVELDRNSGSIAAGGMRSLELTASRFGLKEGRYESVLEIVSPEGIRQIPISMTVGGVEPPDLGTARILALTMDNGEAAVFGGSTTTDASLGYGFSLSVPPGVWYLAAVVDRDGDGTLGPSDLLGFWPNNAEPQAIEVGEDALLEDLYFILEPVGPLSE